MILTQNPRSTNRTKRRRHIAEMKVFFTHTIDLLDGNMGGFVYERCAIATGEVKLNLVSKVLGKSLGHSDYLGLRPCKDEVCIASKMKLGSVLGVWG